MAIDGTGIIASDLASDVYNEFMDLYDVGTLTTEEICKKLFEENKDFFDDALDEEIFYSVMCKATWEIGDLQTEYYEKLKSIYSTESGLEIWKTLGEGLYPKRKKVLEKLIEKLSVPKEKPRKRHKYKTIENFLFEVGDCLCYKSLDGKYIPLFVYKISQYRGHCTYWMGIIDYSKNEMPKMKDFINGKFICHDVGSKKKLIFGIDGLNPEHKDILPYAENFIKIGKLNLDNEKFSCGSANCYSGERQEFEKAIAFEYSLLNLKNDIRPNHFEKLKKILKKQFLFQN